MKFVSIDAYVQKAIFKKSYCKGENDAYCLRVQNNVRFQFLMPKVIRKGLWYFFISVLYTISLFFVKIQYVGGSTFIDKLSVTVGAFYLYISDIFTRYVILFYFLIYWSPRIYKTRIFLSFISFSTV